MYTNASGHARTDWGLLLKTYCGTAAELKDSRVIRTLVCCASDLCDEDSVADDCAWLCAGTGWEGHEGGHEGGDVAFRLSHARAW